MLIVRSQVPLRQPEDDQYRPKHVVVDYIVIKYTACDTVAFDYIQFFKRILSLFIRYGNRMRYCILLSVACQALDIFFSRYLKKGPF